MTSTKQKLINETKNQIATQEREIKKSDEELEMTNKGYLQRIKRGVYRLVKTIQTK